MRKLYQKYFYIPKHGKIREQVMLVRVTVFVSVVLFCLAAMSIAAYAYFSCNVASASKPIKTARFEPLITVQKDDANGEDVPLSQVDAESYLLNLEAKQKYFVTVEHAETSTAGNGFLIIEVEGREDHFHSQQIRNSDDGKITFWIKSGVETMLTIYPQWGTSVYYDEYINQGINRETYIIKDETIELFAEPSPPPEENPIIQPETPKTEEPEQEEQPVLTDPEEEKPSDPEQLPEGQEGAEPQPPTEDAGESAEPEEPADEEEAPVDEEETDPAEDVEETPADEEEAEPDSEENASEAF